ncbi:MAG: hypothetical protein JNM20_03185 [Rhizobiales bacterium]|nr:hypothetical protein [Hyphomicrobiales bacterium]
MSAIGTRPRPVVTPDEIRDLARDVRRIGSGRASNPESILIDKETAADRLFDLARRMENGA